MNWPDLQQVLWLYRLRFITANRPLCSLTLFPRSQQPKSNHQTLAEIYVLRCLPTEVHRSYHSRWKQHCANYSTSLTVTLNGRVTAWGPGFCRECSVCESILPIVTWHIFKYLYICSIFTVLMAVKGHYKQTKSGWKLTIIKCSPKKEKTHFSKSWKARHSGTCP